MTTHSRTLAWKIPWTKEPGGLQSMGPQRVRQDWRDWAQHRSTIHEYNFSFSLWWELLRSSFLVTFKYTVQCFQLQLPYCTLHPHDIYFTTGISYLSYLLQPPLATTSLFFGSKKLLFWGEGYCFLFLCFRFYRMWDHVVFVFLRLVSLSKMPSRSIHVVANGKISSFLMDEFYR